MEKVKLTKEQANAIEYALQEVDEYKGNPDKLLRHASMKNVYFRNELHLLNSIDTVNLAKALYIGYEVEPKFEVGDWVVWDEMKIIGQLVEVGGELRVDSMDYDVPQSIRLNKLRLATPLEIAQEKERRWWKRHGREVWELKDYDVIRDENSETPVTVQAIKSAGLNDEEVVFFKSDDWEYFDNVKEHYSVVCFAEDRKDVDHAE